MASSKIKLDDVSSANGTQKVSLPKYSSQVINLANGYAKATRPDNVGQVSEDIKRFRDDDTLSGYSNQDWINWHQNHYPNGIQKATDEAWAMFVKMRNSLNTCLLYTSGITKHITFHCFRHTYATLQLANGTDIYTVSKMLGHTNVRTTQIYTKVVDEKKENAADAIQINLDNIE